MWDFLGNFRSQRFDPSWRHEPGFSEEFLVDVKQAFDYLESATNNSYGNIFAATLMMRYRAQSLSIRQRLLSEYVLGLAHHTDGDLTQALTHLETAADIADFLEDDNAKAAIGYRAALIYHYLSEFALARSLYNDSLTILQAVEPTRDGVNTAKEIELLLRIAGLDCELANFARAETAASDARYLLLTTNSSKTKEADYARLTWIDALVANWRGRFDQALKLARTTAVTYEQLGMYQLAGRAHGLAAELALDFVDRLTHESQNEHCAVLVHDARPDAMTAIAHARVTNDPVGRQLGYLALQRCRRMHGPTQDGIAVVERVIRQAKRLDDPAVLGRAYTALGDELVCQGQREAARPFYSSATHIFEEFELLGILSWSRRRLYESYEP